MKIFSRFAICSAIFWGMLLLSSCGSTPKTESAAGAQATLTITEPTLSPSQTPLLTATQSPTPDRGLTQTARALTNPPPTPTGTPIVDANGNVTWHPQKVLVTSSDGGGDGYYYYQNHFTLFWNGTLLLPENYDSNGMPYFIQLSNEEICKILNTANTSGFFEEPNYYQFRFQGASGSSITINGWKSNWSGAELLSWAISGYPYYNPLFCSDCSIPTEETIIQPGLANMYSFLQNYRPDNPQKVPVKEIVIDVNPEHGENEAITEWPLKSISLDQFMQLFEQCNENSACREKGLKFSGAIAQEMMDKIGNSQVFKSEFQGRFIFSIDYRPQAPDVPADATLTCNTKTEPYAIVPFNKSNKFWYYAPDGKWGAEVVANENKMRVVNTSGYEKFYSYDAAFFGQSSIQFYPRYWSEDGQYFYVNILPGDYKPNVSLVNSIGLEQIDVKNEKIKYLFLDTKGETFAYQFSTDGKNVAYVRQGDDPLKLVVVNTVSGEEHAVRLTRPDGTPYTAAGTVLWDYHDDNIVLAASYTENGTEKTDILASNPNNLALRVLYSANTLMKLREDGMSYSSASICPILADGNSNCLINLNTETGEVK